MIEGLGGITSQLVGVALDAALLRHEVIANNIANYSTPGYQVKSLPFEEYFAGFTSAFRSHGEESLESRIESVKAQLHGPDSLLLTHGEPVELDREMVKLTENTLWYQAILRAAGKRGEVLSLAINGGRK